MAGDVSTFSEAVPTYPFGGVARGDSAGLGDVTDQYAATQLPLNYTGGIRGDGWKECATWFEAMPGAYFQLGNVFLFLCYMAGGTSGVAAVFTHTLAMLAFLSYTVWGYLDVCAPDIVIWCALIAIVNFIQILVTAGKSSKIRAIMEKDGMERLHAARFDIFDISTQLFVELVTCKGCQITHMDKGQAYAVEKKTAVDRLSLLLSGRMSVHCNGKFLQYITPNCFIDSPEWDAGTNGESQTIFKVTITADSSCTFISWKRKGLLALFAKYKRLDKILTAMIGKDVSDKLYSLNVRCMTERGFRYDIRLPCVISLPADVDQRNREAAAAHSVPGSPGLDSEGKRHRHKKLGKIAAAKYANVLASKLRARVSMRRTQAPVVIRREPLKEDD